MEFTAWTQLQQRLQSLEAVLIRRENVIRFLVARLLLMLVMVLGFWLVVRPPLLS
jgi:hypothetical protein